MIGDWECEPVRCRKPRFVPFPSLGGEEESLFVVWLFLDAPAGTKERFLLPPATFYYISGDDVFFPLEHDKG